MQCFTLHYVWLDQGCAANHIKSPSFFLPVGLGARVALSKCGDEREGTSVKLPLWVSKPAAQRVLDNGGTIMLQSEGNNVSLRTALLHSPIEESTALCWLLGLRMEL